MENIKSIAAKYLRSLLLQESDRNTDAYLETRYLNSYSQIIKDSNRSSIETLIPSSVDELFDEYPEVDENSLFDCSVEYFRSNYDADYFQIMTDRSVAKHEDQIRDELRQELIILLDNSMEFWNNEWQLPVNSVTNIDELARYVGTNDLQTFVETYAIDFAH